IGQFAGRRARPRPESVSSPGRRRGSQEFRVRFRTGAAIVAAAAFTAGSFMVLAPAQAVPEVTQADVEKAFDRAEAANERLNALTEDAAELDQRIDEVNSEIRTIRRTYRTQRAELGADIVQQQLDQPLGPTIGL